MVTKFIGHSEKINAQHRKILKWLEKSSKFCEAYVFLEFDIPGKGSRDVDFLIILPDQIHLLELKGDRFTKIKNGSDWYHINQKNGREEPYIKLKKGRHENPYEQAIDTANILVKFIKNHASNFEESIRIQRFLKTKNFTIFPIVFIDNHNFLDKESIERNKWCRLCIDIEKLAYSLDRDYLHYSKQAVKLDIDSFSGLAAEMSLTNLDKKYTGPLNQTMLIMLRNLIETNSKYKSSEEIRENVFTANIIKKRPVEVKDALHRAKSERIMFLKADGYEINDLFQQLYQISESIEEAYNSWGDLRIFKSHHLNNSEVFRLFTFHVLDLKFEPSHIEAKSKMGSKLARILYEIPRELQYLSIDTILFQEEIDTPEFFRDSGLHAVDIQNQYYCPFSDEYGFDLALSLVQDLQLNTLIILEGEPASGKSTLIRLVGFQLIEKRLPVLLINPQNFSKDTVKSLMYFEEKSKVEETPDIFAILENIHLFSSDQATQLKKILKMQSKIKYLLTTRSIKDTVLEEIVQQDKEYPNTNIVGLDKDGQALNRYMQLIKLFLMKNFPSINTYEIDQVIKRIKKSTKEILSFIQLHIRLLKAAKTKKELLLLWNSSTNFDDLLNSTIIQDVELRLSQTLSQFSNQEDNVRELYLAVFIFAYLEIPLHQDLLAATTKLEKDFIFSVFVLWEAENFVRLDEYADSNLHPVLAKKIYDLLTTHSEKFRPILTNLENQISSTSGSTLIDKFRQEIVQEDPTFLINLLKQKGSSTAMINFEAIDMTRLKFYFDYLYLGDFMHLLYIIEMYYPRWGRKQWCEFFDHLTLEKMQGICEDCDSLGALFRFFKFLQEKGWHKFSDLIESFSSGYYLELSEKDRWNEHSLLQNLKTWGYSRIELIEFNLIFLHIEIMKKNPNDYYSDMPVALSAGTIQTINKLPVESIFEIIDEKYYILRKFMDFLKKLAQQQQSESLLRSRMIESVLTKGLSDYSMSFYCYILTLYNEDQFATHPEWVKIIEKTDINVMINHLLELDASWLKHYLKLIKTISPVLLKKFMSSLSLDQVISIWNIPLENDFDIHLSDLIEFLAECNWSQTSEFIEYFGASYFLEKLDPVKKLQESSEWFEFHLLRVLLEMEWLSKPNFLQKYPFKQLVEELTESTALIIIKLYHQLGLPDTVHLLKITFEKAFQEFFTSSLEKVIAQCEEMNVDWKIWIDIPFIFKQLDKNFYRSKDYLDFLLEHGWPLPSDLDGYITSYKFQEEVRRLQRYSKLEKARYFYSREKKDEAMQVFHEIIEIINDTKNRDLLETFFWNSERIESKDKKDLVNQIDPNLFRGIILDSEQKIHEECLIIRDLSKYGYDQLVKVVYLHSFQTSPKLQKKYWSILSNYFDISNEVEEIWQQYLDFPDYEKMGLLPAEFDALILNSQDLIKERLFQAEDLNAELWQFYVTEYIFNENTNEEEIEEFITSIFNSVINLADLIKIMAFHTKMESIIQTQWMNLNTDEKKRIVQESDPINILRFINILNQNGDHELLILFLRMFPVEKWEIMFENLSLEFKRNIKIIFNQGNFNIFSEVIMIK